MTNILDQQKDGAMTEEEIEDAFRMMGGWNFAVYDLAKGRPDAFCELLRSKQKIPAPVRQFLADVLDGTIPPPPKRRTRDTISARELQAVHVEAIKHMKRQRRGDSRAELTRLRKAAIYELIQRHGRTWDTVEKLFKQELRRLTAEQAGTS